MKKVLLIGAIFLLFASFGIAQTISKHIYVGWNLIPSGISAIEGSSNRECLNNAKAVFWYSPLDSKYYKLSNYAFGSSDLEKLSSLYSQYSDSHYTFSYGSSVWGYFEKECNFTLGSFGTGLIAGSGATEKSIYTGWNFLTVSPDWVGLTVDDIFKNCQSTKLYWWQPNGQMWVKITSAQPFDSSHIGGTVVVKVSQDCQLSREQKLNVPQLPE